MMLILFFLLSFSSCPRAEPDSGRRFIPGFPRPATEIASEEYSSQLTRRPFISSRSRRVDSDWYKGGRTSALHKSAGRSPKVRVSTEQRATNCFEDEVSPRIRKDEPRARFKDEYPLPPSYFSSSRLFIRLNETAGDPFLPVQSRIESAETRGICEKLVEKICLLTLLKIFRPLNFSF